MATRRLVAEQEPTSKKSRGQVDPLTAEAFIAERRIGERIKRLRRILTAGQQISRQSAPRRTPSIKTMIARGACSEPHELKLSRSSRRMGSRRPCPQAKAVSRSR